MRRLLLVLMLIMLAGGAVFVCFGTMEIRYDNVVGVIEHEMVARIDDTLYTGLVELETDDLPPWTRDYYANVNMTLRFDLTDAPAYLALFADFEQVESIHQSKSILTGRLRSEERQTYYRPCGNITIEPVAEDASFAPQFDHQFIKIP